MNLAWSKPEHPGEAQHDEPFQPRRHAIAQAALPETRAPLRLLPERADRARGRITAGAEMLKLELRCEVCGTAFLIASTTIN